MHLSRFLPMSKAFAGKVLASSWSLLFGADFRKSAVWYEECRLGRDTEVVLVPPREHSSAL